MAPASLLRAARLLALLLATDPSAVFALQRIEARDGVSVEAAIALKEPTRIKIDGAAISDVFGNLYSTNCAAASTAPLGPNGPALPAINPAGEVVLECDKERGEIYVKPVGASTKPINLFISSGKATYTLVLKRVDMPADTIMIVDRTPAPATTRASTVPGRAPQHTRALKAMLLAMASDEAPRELSVQEVHRPVQLWAEARFTLLRVFEGREFTGERYLLVNVSPGPMRLAEEEFDRAGGDVVAVSIETHALAPGESTQVFVIREGNQPWRR